MALKITRAADPITVDRLNVTIYAQPGIGKTSLAFTAEAPLLLDFDQGAHRAANRQDSVRVESMGRRGQHQCRRPRTVQDHHRGHRGPCPGRADG
jgi:hypothetical protein